MGEQNAANEKSFMEAEKLYLNNQLEEATEDLHIIKFASTI